MSISWQYRYKLGQRLGTVYTELDALSRHSVTQDNIDDKYRDLLEQVSEIADLLGEVLGHLPADERDWSAC